ncbi:hypothetical protein Q8F55_001315 [Vanrija albida]|uniref:Zn(2)-C6 fungal-type domain-containing protein n=1 Tax=Vanrija albida TaxID=181172 RepID=A0ABR3QFQ4_9TREE
MNGHHQPFQPGNPYAQVGYQQQAPQPYYDGTNGVSAVPHDPAQQQGLNGAPPAAFTGNVMVSPLEQRRPQHLSVQVKPDAVAPTITFDYAQTQHTQQQHTPVQPSFFMNGFDSGPATPGIVGHDGAQISGFHPTPVDPAPMHHLTMPAQEWPPARGKKNRGPDRVVKVPRHQFTACGACRHRRVKCDLRTRQEEAERAAILDDPQGTSPVRRHKVSCTNCQERGTNCVDEYAPLKAAKQLRRGKRISEIEMLYGKSATDAALASQGDDLDRPLSPSAPKHERIPELTREFFESSFLRRFHIQRPLIDPIELEKRYFSKPLPCAAAMGPEGAVLIHCIYAWGLSFGVNERGQLDVPDGGSEPIGPIHLHAPSDAEQRRQQERQRRSEKMARAVRVILKEIDDCAMMRRPSWDGVRCLLLIVPLSEGIQSPVERQAMYQAAISQVYMLCSTHSTGYDGTPAGDAIDSFLPVLKEVEDRREAVRARIYWYAFCHEGIQMGLRGSDLRLGADDHPMSTVNDAVSGYDGHLALISSQSLFDHSLRMASASVRLALACRMIHGALTGPKARRTEKVNGNEIRQIWEALEQSWEEFESLKHESANAPFRQTDEVVYFSDAWKVYLFEAQHVIRKQLEERLERLESKPTGAFLTDANSRSTSPVASESETEILTLRHLLDIARHKCDDKVRNIVDSLRGHITTSFFEWDASMVRDGTFYTAQYLAKEGGTDDDIALCIQGLNEMRWCHAKAVDRSQE